MATLVTHARKSWGLDDGRADIAVLNDGCMLRAVAALYTAYPTQQWYFIVRSVLPLSLCAREFVYVCASVGRNRPQVFVIVHNLVTLLSSLDSASPIITGALTEGVQSGDTKRTVAASAAIAACV
jgi:hypothetical protein